VEVKHVPATARLTGCYREYTTEPGCKEKKKRKNWNQTEKIRGDSKAQVLQQKKKNWENDRKVKILEQTKGPKSKKDGGPPALS